MNESDKITAKGVRKYICLSKGRVGGRFWQVNIVHRWVLNI